MVLSLSAIDADGNLGDSQISEKRDRDRDASKKFCEQALAVVGHAPEQVTTDGHRSYPRAVRETMGDAVQHRTNTYLNNLLEQDHRGIKQRSYPMRGFGNVTSAARFCRAFDDLRQDFCSRRTTKEDVSLAQQRRLFLARLAVLQELMGAASSFSR